MRNRKTLTDDESRALWTRLRAGKSDKPAPKPPRKLDAMQHSVQIRLSEEDWSWLLAYTADKKTSVSGLLRDLVIAFKKKGEA